MRHIAFLPQLIMEEVDLESISAASNDHNVPLMRALDAPTSKVFG